MAFHVLLVELVNVEQLKPEHTTYKELISKLLVQGGFQNALSFLGLMKNQGFPPFLDPFIEYVSKSGTGENAINFLKEMTSKRFPATFMFLRTFEAFFKVGRHFEAQNFLSKSLVEDSLWPRGHSKLSFRPSQVLLLTYSKCIRPITPFGRWDFSEQSLRPS